MEPPVTTTRIARIEFGILEAQRPRPAGSNARLGEHGSVIRLPIARVTTTDGATGFGLCRATKERLQALIGAEIPAAFDPAQGLPDVLIPLEFPLLDLIAKQRDLPVYQLVSADAGNPLRVPCYDTSLYFDDLHLADHDEAADLIAGEAMEGWARGHRNFKLKIGRGARHMPLDSGTQRDIHVIRAVREAVGPNARIMIDANNGYTLNLAKHVLRETAACAIYWMEEAFHEDPVLYRDLKEWLARENLAVLIADGEGDASPQLMQWARDGLVEVVQYDIVNPGFSRWLGIGRVLDGIGARSAPHHYGTLFGNYASCHLAPAIAGFQLAEWDEATAPGLDASAWTIADGHVTVPDLPGFGLHLDEATFTRATGFILT
jgi:L-alanine-DL-glutamate epimerase-like enolase superfamily enzyme